MHGLTTYLTPDNAEAATSTQTLVAQLRQSEIFRAYQNAFQTTTGLPLALRSVGSFQPLLHGAKRTNPFCALMAARNRSCAACLQLQQQIEDGASAEANTLECFAGLNDSLVPVRVGEKLIGHLQTGQILLRQPSRARFENLTRQLREWDAASEVRELEAVYFRTRVLSRRHYESTLRLLAIFAQHLAALSNRLMIQAAAVEPPVIATARRFIESYEGDDLSLATMARVAKMSPFHFCKQFKRWTGLTFTRYVARVRVEKTQRLLLNPHMRISEAAYAAGFQSLTQFNRVFRDIAGEAPSAYRERLHGGSGNVAPRAALVRAA